MSPTAASPRRRRPVTGVAVAIGIALTTVVVANGSAGNAGPVPTRSAGPPPVSSIVSDCASMGTVLAAAVTGTSPGAGPDAVGAARGRAAAVARSTTSDEVRERVQNLADDLAAYRVAVASPASAEQTARRADIGVMVRDDLAALRRLCGR